MTPGDRRRFDAALEIEDLVERLKRLRVLAAGLSDNPEIQQQIALSHLRLGDKHEYYRVLAASLETVEDGWTRVYLGNACWLLDDLDAAEEHFLLARKLLPDLSVAVWSLADIKRVRGQTGEAEALYREAVGVEPDCPAAHAHLGRALLGSGDDVEGTMHVLRALDLDPSCRVAKRVADHYQLMHEPVRVVVTPAVRPRRGLTGDEWQDIADGLEREASRVRASAAAGDASVLDKETHDDPRWLDRKGAEAAKRADKKENAREHKENQRRKDHRQ